MRVYFLVTFRRAYNVDSRRRRNRYRVRQIQGEVTSHDETFWGIGSLLFASTSDHIGWTDPRKDDAQERQGSIGARNDGSDENSEISERPEITIITIVNDPFLFGLSRV